MTHPGVPAGWPRTSEPLSVAILGWARLSLQAAEGSGYNLNASELAAGLVMMGHSVHYLSSGMSYSVRPGIRLRHREAWRGVRCDEIVNSPNLSPAAANFSNHHQEMHCAKQTRLVLRWLSARNVQVVHVHSLEGFSFDLIAAMRSAGHVVVITPHNYWYACGQVDLLYKEHALCRDYEGGVKCVDCLQADRPALQRAKRAAVGLSERIAGPKQTELIRLKAKRFQGPGRSERSPRRERRNLLPDDSVARGHSVSAEDNGLLNHRFFDGDAAEPAAPVPLHFDENERFTSRGDLHLRVINTHGQRRRAGLAAMKQAHLVTPPSEFNRSLHASMGVSEDMIRVLPYGQPHFDQINRKTRRSPFYHERPWRPGEAARPLRLGFFGTTRANKGLEVLVRAVRMLDRDVRARCQFIVRAAGKDWEFRKRMAAYPEMNFLGGYDILQLINAGGEYDVGLLPHVWFDNSPLVMWEHLHAGKMVIAARLGGAADTIRSLDDDSRGNGLFFAGGVAADLARQITRIVTGEVVVPSAAEVHDASELQTYPGHVTEVDSIYRELMRSNSIS